MEIRQTPIYRPEHDMKTIVLTDAPAIVELKRKFKQLDGELEWLKLVEGTANQQCEIQQQKRKLNEQIFYETHPQS